MSVHAKSSQLTDRDYRDNTRQETIGAFDLTAANECSQLQSGAELNTDTSSRTLSAPGSDAHAVFVYSITDEVNKMQYLSNTQMFQKHLHEQQKHFFYTS